MSDAAGWIDWLAIAAGGAVGAVLRGLLARLAATPIGAGSAGSGPRLDPGLATLAANLAACALLGGWTAVAAGREPTGALAAFVGIGICGSLSTFSTLCADADRLARAAPGDRIRSRALGYLVAHLVGGPLALAGGAWLAG